MRNLERRTEHDQLRQVLEDLEAGKIVLAQGQDEYLSRLKRRIADLEGQMGSPNSQASGL
jgi:hypothetical protein